ncbi:MAG: GMC family oxidoreductase N-terminal domain-containing protein, partial [Alphaproteobacteria bacterium]|nr:GMC family oxidoreductase N-terminal domain-containing protein [Alphaproteobacteria bacterium]
KDGSPFIHIPVGFIRTLNSKTYNWHFETEPEDNTNGRVIPVARGKVLGGSSSINGMVYVRGQARDYDGWAQMGNRGWSWDDVLPYFVKSENREGATDETPWRGRGGLLNVSDVTETYPLLDRLIDAAVECGYSRTQDYNSGDQEGFSYYQVTQKNGRRWSTATAFLDPARSRPNLTIEINAFTTQILLEGTRAVGVVFDQKGAQRRVRAHREVILSAGAVQSPQILEASGIGQPKLLSDHGIEVRHALPGVGENYRDHYLIRMVWRVKNARTLNEQTRGLAFLGEVAKWAFTRKGVLSLPGGILSGFVRSRPDLEGPDLQMRATHASFKDVRKRILDDFPGITLAPNQLRPESRGSIHIKSANPKNLPSIRTNFLSDEIDRQALVAAMKISRNLIAAPAMAPYIVQELAPTAGAVSDDELLDVARRDGATVFHPVGTCKMGQDTMAVVDDRLRVHGLSGLRVIDASIMPVLISGNTNAPTIMIAEKGAAMILEDAIA